MFYTPSELSIGIRAGTLSDLYILSVILDPTMDRSQSLNAPPFIDGSNYAFWKVCMHAFLCSIDESVWDDVENNWTRPILPWKVT